MKAPKPTSRAGEVSFFGYARLFRRDLLSAQPERLYRAWMAEFRAPFLRSFMVNQPKLVRDVLDRRASAFPKSRRVAAGLRPLLGRSVFLTDGPVWAAQRRIVDPAFSGGRVRAAFPAMRAAAEAAAERVRPGVIEAEALASHATADVIFRALFSRPIEDDLAARTFAAFRAYQRRQPVLSLAAFLPWLPTLRGRREAKEIRSAIAALVSARQLQIEDGTAPDDLGTRLMTTPDPETGRCFSRAEMIDQVSIFFLAGHETTASTLAWALWLLAADPETGRAVAEEARAFMADPSQSALAGMAQTREVIRETLRLYPPVPMMVREARGDGLMRGRTVPKGAQMVISLWHLHRHTRLWDDPDDFRPARWREETPEGAYLPFSAGPRICPGAGFATVELTVMLAALIARWRFEPEGADPIPVAHLTLRSEAGILLRASERTTPEATADTDANS